MTQRATTEASGPEPSRDWEKLHRLVVERVKDEASMQALKADLEQWVAAQTAELTEANTRLQEINAAKDALLTVAAHDLRASLGFIQNAAELLQDEPGLPPQALSLVLRIGQAANQTFELLIKLLDLSRLQMGSIVLERRRLLISSVCRQAIEVLQHAALAKALTIELKIAPDEIRIEADEIRLYQVITNLLSNAIKFTHCGGAITLIVAPEPGGMSLCVTDTGIGIPPEYLLNLFEQYRQLHRIGTADEHGSGLGLVIVRQLVELHGGTIEVSSTIDQGSTFIVHLPRNDSPLPTQSE